jgi:hypothetical protein
VTHLQQPLLNLLLYRPIQLRPQRRNLRIRSLQIRPTLLLFFRQLGEMGPMFLQIGGMIPTL